MALPVSALLAALRQYALLPPNQIQEAEGLATTFQSAEALAGQLAARGLLSEYQAGELAAGRGTALVLGSYTLHAKLGEGGTGAVFRARHRVMHREVALKCILAKRLGSAAAVERFLKEIRAVSQLSHPNIVQLYDAGESGGTHFLAMELLRGADLADYLELRGQLPPPEAVGYVRQACLGMQHAHEKGIIHRNLMPANLMLTESGQVKILNLGLALVANAVTLTQWHAGGFGTADYMAPEQVNDAHNVDIRADIYSLGCILYHLLAGMPPFDAIHPAARPAMHLIAQEPPALEEVCPGVPTKVATVVRIMMAKRREQRYMTPGEAAEALAALLLRRRHGAGRGQSVPPALTVTGGSGQIKSPTGWSEVEVSTEKARTIPPTLPAVVAPPTSQQEQTPEPPAPPSMLERNRRRWGLLALAGVWILFIVISETFFILDAFNREKPNLAAISKRGTLLTTGSWQLVENSSHVHSGWFEHTFDPMSCWTFERTGELHAGIGSTETSEFSDELFSTPNSFDWRIESGDRLVLVGTSQDKRQFLFQLVECKASKLILRPIDASQPNLVDKDAGLLTFKPIARMQRKQHSIRLAWYGEFLPTLVAFTFACYLWRFLRCSRWLVFFVTLFALPVLALALAVTFGACIGLIDGELYRGFLPTWMACGKKTLYVCPPVAFLTAILFTVFIPRRPAATEPVTI